MRLHKNWWLLLLCIFAATRVGVYCGAFPLFNNVDEIMHFDLVMKYGENRVPEKIENLSKVSACYIAGCGTEEYAAWDSVKAKKNYPFFSQNLQDTSLNRIYKGLRDWYTTIPNYESAMPPLYYRVTGLWARLGQISGLFDEYSCGLAYWVRYLNILFIIALVLIAHKAALLTFPENRFMHLCVPMLAAVIPQDTFYSIQNDVLSPILFGLAYIGAIKILNAPHAPRPLLALSTGLFTAALILTKLSNLPLFILIVIFVSYKIAVLFRQKKREKLLLTSVVFYVFSLLPLIVLIWWNLSTYGDLFASNQKIEHLHWKQKPLNQWLDTNFLSGGGVYGFWTELMASFWRGELVWNSRRLTYEWMDAFYWGSSLLFLAPAIFGLYDASDARSKIIKRLTIWSFLSLILFMIYLSLNYDFTGCAYPSAQKPWFESGRLISGACIPFLFLYLGGFYLLTGFIKSNAVKIALVAIICIIITSSEVMVNKVVFSSNFSLFSL